MLASLSFRVSRREALAVWGRVARSRVVLVMPGEGSFIVVLACLVDEGWDEVWGLFICVGGGAKFVCLFWLVEGGWRVLLIS